MPWLHVVPAPLQLIITPCHHAAVSLSGSPNTPPVTIRGKQRTHTYQPTPPRPTPTVPCLSKSSPHTFVPHNGAAPLLPTAQGELASSQAVNAGLTSEVTALKATAASQQQQLDGARAAADTAKAQLTAVKAAKANLHVSRGEGGIHEGREGHCIAATGAISITAQPMATISLC